MYDDVSFISGYFFDLHFYVNHMNHVQDARWWWFSFSCLEFSAGISSSVIFIGMKHIVHRINNRHEITDVFIYMLFLQPRWFSVIIVFCDDNDFDCILFSLNVVLKIHQILNYVLLYSPRILIWINVFCKIFVGFLPFYLRNPTKIPQKKKFIHIEILGEY